MNGANGQVVPFSAQDDGGDLVETAFLMQGLLCVRQYFNATDAEETDLRDDITVLWQDVNWNWYRKLVNNVLYWHWSPNHQFAINLPIRGFNESQIVYLLAIAAPVSTHKIPAQLYHSGWAGSGYTTSQSYYGYPLGVGTFRGGRFSLVTTATLDSTRATSETPTPTTLFAIRCTHSSIAHIVSRTPTTGLAIARIAGDLPPVMTPSWATWRTNRPTVNWTMEP
jgi:hypothetical protein